MKFRERQHLIIDADDTLWENNIYFERAFDEFYEFLAHSSMSPAEVRAVLDEIETVNTKIHGYGAANFARNLTRVLSQAGGARGARRGSAQDHEFRRTHSASSHGS